MQSRTLMQRLKEETRELHGAAEGQPYMRALMEGRLPREVFAAAIPLLRDVRLFLEERLIANLDNAAVAACFGPHHRLGRFFDQDVEFFFVTPPVRANRGVDAFRQLVTTAEAANPLYLLGAFYVLEGSNLGGAILKRKVQETYGLGGSEGTASLDPHGSQLYVRWREFSQTLDSLGLDAAAQDGIVETAKKAFAAIGELYSDLYSPSDAA
jgi:heme oxygenase